MIIRPMRYADLDFAASCTAAEEWASETRPVFETFFQHDPGGCFIVEVEGQGVGICMATSYGQSGFIGELIVVEERRGRGIGQQIMEHATEYLRGRGARNIYLDGVLAAVPLYERIGFRKVCRSLRVAGMVEGRTHPDVRAMRTEDLEAIGQLDHKAFGADRSFFLKRRLVECPTLCKVLERDGEILGYIMGRPAWSAISVGPWIVRPWVERPANLLEGLAAERGVLDVRLGILESNEQAVSVARSFGLVSRPDSPWRMVLGPSADLGASRSCFCIGSAAKG